MSFLQTRLIFHISSDTLNRCEIAQITVPRKCGCKSALRSIKKLRIRKLVFRFLRTDERRRGPRLHQLLDEVADLALCLGDVLLIFDLVNILVFKVGFLAVLFMDMRLPARVQLLPDRV